MPYVYTDLSKAVRMAFLQYFRGATGDDARIRLNHNNHEFWLHPVNVSADASGVRILSGQISHMLGNALDDQVYFTMSHHGGEWETTHLETQAGGFSALMKFIKPLAEAGAAIASAVTLNPAFVEAGKAMGPIEEFFQAVDDYISGGWKASVAAILGQIMAQGTPTLRFYWWAGGKLTHVPHGFVQVQVQEPAEPRHVVFWKPLDVWKRTFLLIDNEPGVEWRWSYAGVPAGFTGILFLEPTDPHTWADNYLCYKGALGWEVRFSAEGPISGYASEEILVMDPDWKNNFLLWKKLA
ncbi:MAG: hypothetical protein KC620_20715 [Myxococcales bacterium]|nr:hypothetical protein [Myxococcales bacterium]